MVQIVGRCAVMAVEVHAERKMAAVGAKMGGLDKSVMHA